jgi:hypothetical protein
MQAGQLTAEMVGLEPRVGKVLSQAQQSLFHRRLEGRVLADEALERSLEPQGGNQLMRDQRVFAFRPARNWAMTSVAG